MTRDILCWQPQHSAIIGLLEPYCLRRIVPVYHRDQLQGLEDVVFAVYVGHLHPVPEVIYQLLRERGVVLWNLDDSLTRDRYNARNRGSPGA